MLYLIRAVYLLIHFVTVCAYAIINLLIFPRRLNNTSKLSRMMSWSLPLLGIKLVRKNNSPLAADKQAIYVSNHQDTLDIFICTGMMPDNIAILGKKSLLYVPFFGLAFWLAGNILINRSDKKQARSTMIEVSKAMRERGNSVYMFPEGTRSRGKGLLPFKKGAFILAIESGLPIVPLVFSSTRKNINLNRWRAGTVLAEFLEPIYTHNMGPEDVQSLLEHTRELISTTVERLDKEVNALQGKDSQVKKKANS